MKLLLGVLFVLMAASSFKFTVSSVKYTQREKYPNYYRPYLNKPRRPYNHTVVDVPQHIVDMLTNMVDIEKEKCEKKGKCMTVGPYAKFWPFYEHQDVQDAITETMQPVAEKLAGQKLQFSGLFGVREYKKGAFVQMHFDMRDTYVFGFSCLHSKDHDWFFTTEEKPGTRWNVELEPGQCIYYTAADYLHGRPTYYEGDSYMGWYLHYRPRRSEEQKQLKLQGTDDVVVGGNI